MQIVALLPAVPILTEADASVHETGARLFSILMFRRVFFTFFFFWFFFLGLPVGFALVAHNGKQRPGIRVAKVAASSTTSFGDVFSH